MHMIKRKPLVGSIETTRYGPSTESFSDDASLYHHGRTRSTIPQQRFDVLFAPIRRERTAGARLIRSPTITDVLVSIADVILTVIPVGFLVLAFQALRLNGMPLGSGGGHIVEQAAKLGSTLFPIVFAAIVGSLMKTYALWCAGRGAELGKLELLQGSQALLATVERAIMVRGPPAVGLIVVLLWMLSPLGGQSSLRVLGTATRASVNTSQIFYLNTTGTVVQAGAFGETVRYDWQGASMRAILSASMLSPGRTKGSDTWGNIRVPFLHRVSSYETAAPSTRGDAEAWYEFSEQDYSEPYTSLTGVVVNGLSLGVNTNFTMVTTHLNLTCPDRRVFVNYTLPSWHAPSFQSEITEWTGALVRTENMTRNAFRDDGYFDTYFIDTNYNGGNDSAPSQRLHVIYASKGVGLRDMTVFKCDTEVLEVESQVACTGLTCRIHRLRLCPTRRWSPGHSPFDVEQGFRYSLSFLDWVSRATTSASKFWLSPIDAYVSGVDNAFTRNLGDVNFGRVNNAQFSERLGSIFNTAWQTALQDTSTASGISQYNDTYINGTTVTPHVGDYYLRETASARTVVLGEVYTAQYVWIATTVAVSSMLCAAGLASLYFKYSCPAPDILGYVSSMTRDNPNFEQIPDGDKMDGLERARVMRKVKVQIVDAKPWDPEGYVTLRCLNRGD